MPVCNRLRFPEMHAQGTSGHVTIDDSLACRLVNTGWCSGGERVEMETQKVDNQT